MNYSIKDIMSLKELQEFLETNQYLLEGKKGCFMRILVDEWDDGLYGKKLIEFQEPELAKKMSLINPSQSPYEICKAIYAIILNQKPNTKSLTYDDHMDYDDWKSNQIWSEVDF